MAAHATHQPDASTPAPGQTHMPPLFSDSPDFHLGDLVALNAQAAKQRDHCELELRTDLDPIDWPAIDRIFDDEDDNHFADGTEIQP